MIKKLPDLEKLFHATIKNASSLTGSVISLLNTDQKHIALGLAELTLEEIGKSFTCLAYLSREFTNEDIQKDWKSHNKKAHRAFLYEFFSTKRLELIDRPDYFPTKRDGIYKEKEFSFYVDYDQTSGEIITPSENVDLEEVGNRVCSLYGPLLVASQIHDLLIDRDEKYKRAFSDWAYFVMTNNIYQQESLEKLQNMKTNEKEYDSGIDEIIRIFSTREGSN